MTLTCNVKKHCPPPILLELTFSHYAVVLAILYIQNVCKNTGFLMICVYVTNQEIDGWTMDRLDRWQIMHSDDLTFLDG